MNKERCQMLPDGGILKKIQNILAKAESTTNEEEAKVFFMKAQELMAKNDISMEQIKVKKEPEEIIQEMAKSGKKTTAVRNLDLASIIAKNFKCATYFCSNGKEPFIMFMGHKNDVKIANMTFDTISKFMEKKRSHIYRQYKKEGKDTKGIRESYTTGFLAGLQQGFFKNVEEKGLIVVTPKDVMDEFNKMNSRTVSLKRKVNDSELYHKGLKDGKGFGREIEN
jgi:hypothetical protein